MTRTDQTTLDQLYSRTSAYRQSQEYLDTLRFVAAMREFSPYNAFLLRLQRPRLRFAATATEWMTRFGRWPRVDPEPNPLVVLRPFGPVEFVYDLADTDGPEFPPYVLEPFQSGGMVQREQWDHLLTNMERRGMRWRMVREEVTSAGGVRRLASPLSAPKGQKGKRALPPVRFNVDINSLHDRTTQFVTLLHELAHVTCGHLGADPDDDWSDRQHLPLDVVEFEAESVAYLVGTRLGLSTPSEVYLADYAGRHGEIPRGMSINTVFTAAWLLEEWTRELSWSKKPQRRASAERARAERRRLAELSAGLV